MSLVAGLGLLTPGLARAPEGAVLTWPDGQQVELHRGSEIRITTCR